MCVGGGVGGFNSCVISPFKFHKQLHFLCAIFFFRSVMRGKQRRSAESRARRGRRREQKFLLEISATALAWPFICVARGALRVGASASTSPNNYAFIVIML